MPLAIKTKQEQSVTPLPHENIIDRYTKTPATTNVRSGKFENLVTMVSFYKTLENRKILESLTEYSEKLTQSSDSGRYLEAIRELLEKSIIEESVLTNDAPQQ